METLLVCLLAGYGLWLAAYLWWERRQAGRLFGQMQGTEFFDRLVSGSSDIAEKITGLMDYYLSPPFPTAGNAEAAAAAPYIATDAPDGLAGFDIRDFV